MEKYENKPERVSPQHTLADPQSVNLETSWSRGDTNITIASWLLMCYCYCLLDKYSSNSSNPLL